mmetsp:Transcript_11145/g.19679  ORF Transcript_11145/g.19679 Transcript_11145/m.19679 type:complete len:337 (+) Transcript_11145:1551-2561(+)
MEFFLVGFSLLCFVVAFFQRTRVDILHRTARGHVTRHCRTRSTEEKLPVDGEESRAEIAGAHLGYLQFGTDMCVAAGTHAASAVSAQTSLVPTECVRATAALQGATGERLHAARHRPGHAPVKQLERHHGLALRGGDGENSVDALVPVTHQRRIVVAQTRTTPSTPGVRQAPLVHTHAVKRTASHLTTQRPRARGSFSAQQTVQASLVARIPVTQGEAAYVAVFAGGLVDRAKVRYEYGAVRIRQHAAAGGSCAQLSARVLPPGQEAAVPEHTQCMCLTAAHRHRTFHATNSSRMELISGDLLRVATIRTAKLLDYRNRTMTKTPVCPNSPRIHLA